MVESLLEIPRIGEKTARRLIEHFGSEKEAIAALIKCDISSIGEVAGIGRKYAISLVQEVRGLMNGGNSRDFLRTKEAYEIYERILEVAKRFAHTDYARDKLNLYIPYSKNKKDKITSIQREISQAISIIQDLDEDIDELLSNVKPIVYRFSFSKVRERVLIATTQGEYEAARTKFGEYVEVQLAEDLDSLIDIVRGYSYVFLLGERFAGADLPEEVEVEFIPDLKKAEEWQIVPEKILGFFAKNLRSIESSLKIANMIRKYYPLGEAVDEPALSQIASSIGQISPGCEVREGHDGEIDRIKLALSRLGEAIADAETRAEEAFLSLLEESSIILKGKDLLGAMHGQGIQHLFERELAEKYLRAIAGATKELERDLGLNSYESRYLDGLFSEEVSHPIQVNPKAVEDLRRHLSRQLAHRKLKALRENARTLFKYKEAVSRIVLEVLDFDVTYSIACFAREYGLAMPGLLDKPGMGLVGGSNIFLKEHCIVAPINYAVGTTRYSPKLNGKTDSSRVVLLSGVNSGGKTSTIELLAQTIILAHMGFPVPCKYAEVGLVEELFYFAKSKGTLDAGAFEATLKDFSAVATKKSKIVLVDELESITEPGASAKIIAGILEVIEANPNCLGVFVSHLAESVLKNTGSKIRVDGIEARGLDPDSNLIVDRNPRYNYLARSTPELIVERLSRGINGNREFYEHLLGKFRS